MSFKLKTWILTAFLNFRTYSSSIDTARFHNLITMLCSLIWIWECFCLDSQILKTSHTFRCSSRQPKSAKKTSTFYIQTKLRWSKASCSKNGALMTMTCLYLSFSIPTPKPDTPTKRASKTWQFSQFRSLWRIRLGACWRKRSPRSQFQSRMMDLSKLSWDKHLKRLFTTSTKTCLLSFTLLGARCASSSLRFGRKWVWNSSLIQI